jgi:Capsule assembly protein Wzi
VPWTTLRRLALEAGRFPPLVQPVSKAELADLLSEIRAIAERDSLPALVDEAEQACLQGLEDLYSGESGSSGDFGQWRASGRLILGFSELGDPVGSEAGLAFAPGWNASLEPSLSWSAAGAWASISPRWRGQVHSGGVDFGGDIHSLNPMTWPGWTIPTGKNQVRSARLDGGDWRWELPRVMAGLQVGHWSLGLGRTQRNTGTGVSGSLGLDPGGTTFPAATVRRTRPFAWQGPIRRLAPHDLLLRAGILSEREGRYRNEWGQQSWTTRPWFMQWLLGWEVTRWFRFSTEHTVMAATEEGTLWWDLPQINFPVVGTTWRESASGPVTDRVFNVQMEFRWSRAPWPVLPRDAGRLYWQYGGTDFLPRGPGGVIPEISVPASIAGVELFSPRWDLGLEYAELVHEVVLWYSNGGFPEGYSQDGSLLGHSLGGSGEMVAGNVRYRPAGRSLEIGLNLERRTWGMERRTPGTAERTSMAATIRRLARRRESTDALRSFLWEFSVEWIGEEADPTAFSDIEPGPSPISRQWWRVICRLPLQ